MLSPTSAHGLLVAPESGVSSNDRCTLCRGGIIWSESSEDGPPEGGEVPDLEPVPPLYAPSVNAEDIEEIARRL
jgi:hypothetical protein